MTGLIGSKILEDFSGPWPFTDGQHHKTAHGDDNQSRDNQQVRPVAELFANDHADECAEQHARDGALPVATRAAVDVLASKAETDIAENGDEEGGEKGIEQRQSPPRLELGPNERRAVRVLVAVHDRASEIIGGSYCSESC